MKYINGHSESVGGALITPDEELHSRLRFHQNAAGAILSPFDNFIISRGGIKMLAVRMERHERNALAVAKFLETHSKVGTVGTRGLTNTPNTSWHESR